MSIGFAKSRNPKAIPEHRLWRLVKDGKTAEARVRQVPIGLELRFYARGRFLWSQVYRDGEGVQLGAFSETKRGEFIARGWVEDDGAKR